ncbi:MAG: asparaginase [Gemmatimonadales bacterium]
MIHLLATGGTIAMQRSSAAGGIVPALGGRELLARVGAWGPEPVEVEDWERLPAVHRGPAELMALRERVGELVSAPNPPIGIVITHGTDTLEETAYLLARTLPGDIPIVVTGAMRTSSDPDWDGPRNLRDAIRVALARDARGRGAMVVFAGRILPGLGAVKLDTFSPEAFGVPHGTPLGAVEDGTVRFAVAPGRPGTPLRISHLNPRVALIPLVLGDDGRLLELARPRFDGVVIEAFGRGNVPPGILPAVRQWLGEGKPVVLASRCPFGEVGGEYAFEGGGGLLLSLGVIPAGPRTASLARLELVLCLAAGVGYGASG